MDAPPTEGALLAASQLIEADMRSAGVDATNLHPALIPAAAYQPVFTPAVELEHARLQADPTSKLAAIDAARYQELEPPANTTPTTDEDRPDRKSTRLNSSHWE